jgi:hypothetical protein
MSSTEHHPGIVTVDRIVLVARNHNRVAGQFTVSHHQRTAVVP